MEEMTPDVGASDPGIINTGHQRSLENPACSEP